jgi:hypothetical protein
MTANSRNKAARLVAEANLTAAEILMLREAGILAAANPQEANHSKNGSSMLSHRATPIRIAAATRLVVKETRR